MSLQLGNRLFKQMYFVLKHITLHWHEQVFFHNWSFAKIFFCSYVKINTKLLLVKSIYPKLTIIFVFEQVDSSGKNSQVAKLALQVWLYRENMTRIGEISFYQVLPHLCVTINNLSMKNGLFVHMAIRVSKTCHGKNAKENL